MKSDRLFETAVRAIDAGDLPALERLLAEHPELASARLTHPGSWLTGQIGPALQGFFKDPYLLWLLTEDAPRTHRLPANVAGLARAIVDAARRERAPNLQELLDSSLHFAVCSPIGREDGLQLGLIDVLVDAGAGLDDIAVQALICGNEPAAERLLVRGAPVTLAAAVCLERWEDVSRLGPTASQREKQMALALAALNGKAAGLARLLPFGVELDAYSPTFYSHGTALHHAVWSGSLDAVRVLVDAGASLTIQDTAYEGTPLGWAEYALSGPAEQRAGKQFGEIAAYLRSRGAS